MTVRTETFTLPWPPSANHSKVFVHGRFVSSKELKDYHKLAFWTIREARVKPMEPPYDVTLVFNPPKNVSRFDLGNYEKAPVDALTKAGLITDDSKINKLTLIRGPKLKDGRVVVTVTEMEGNGDG